MGIARRVSEVEAVRLKAAVVRFQSKEMGLFFSDQLPWRKQSRL